MILALLFACSQDPAPKPSAPSAASTAPATPAPAPAPAASAPAAPVGPDGPLTIAIPAIAAIPSDAASIAAGEKVYGARGCGGCHTFGSKLVGPDLVGVTQRRTLPWVERMILAPDVMIKEDPVAKDLYRSIMTPMPKQGVTDEELPQLLAFIQSKGG